MAEPLTATLVLSTLVTAALTASAQAIVKGVATKVGMAAAQRVEAVLNDKAIQKNIARHVSDYSQVKTIWSPETTVRVESFFVPPRLRDPGTSRTVELEDPLTLRRNSAALLFTGTVGQGKSILMRFLAGDELKRGRLPLFIELRNVMPTTLLEAVRDQLHALGASELTPRDVSSMLKSGHVSLFLDGLDEVLPQRIRGEAIEEIDAFVESYPETLTTVSSRPGTGLEHSARFRVLRLSELEAPAVPTLIRSFARDDKLAQSLTENLERREYGALSGLLTTPLMVALLVIRYRLTDKIPRTYANFYESLFELLLERHDRQKKGFRRRRQSALNEEQLRTCFDHCCYQLKREAIGDPTTSLTGELSKRSVAKNFEKAAKAVGKAGEGAKALADVVGVTCLILEEGAHCRFVHRSVLEYHVASFIRSVRGDGADSFYKAMASGGWRDWGQELAFLMTIDAERFARQFATPTLSRLLGRHTSHSRPTATEWAVKSLGDVQFYCERYADEDDSVEIGLRLPTSVYGDFWLMGIDRPNQHPRTMTLLRSPEFRDAAVNMTLSHGTTVPERGKDIVVARLADLVAKGNPTERSLLAGMYAPIHKDLCDLNAAVRDQVRAAAKRAEALKWDLGNDDGS